MNDDESMKEYIARAKFLALNIKYHDVDVTDQNISRRVLNGLPPSYVPEKRNFALKTDFSLAELEGGLVHVEELHTWAFCYLRTPLQSEISFLADTLWISLQSLEDTHKMVDGVSLACIIFGFLVDFPCARFENTWSARLPIFQGAKLYLFVVRIQ